MIYNKQCPVCGNSFEAKKEKTRFCTPKCFSASRAVPVDLEKILNLYVSGMTSQEIGKELGLTTWTVHKNVQNLQKEGKLKVRAALPREIGRGATSNTWKGGRRKCSSGYIMILAPEHPRSVYGYVPEHILIAESIIGRYLNYHEEESDTQEIVHHVNGIRHDNRTENLVFMSHLDHRKLHNRIMSKQQVISKATGETLGTVRELAERLNITNAFLLTYIHLRWELNGDTLLLPTKKGDLFAPIPEYRLLSETAID